jgi:hypothetical protein
MIGNETRGVAAGNKIGLAMDPENAATGATPASRQTAEAAGRARSRSEATIFRRTAQADKTAAQQFDAAMEVLEDFVQTKMKARRTTAQRCLNRIDSMQGRVHSVARDHGDDAGLKMLAQEAQRSVYDLSFRPAHQISVFRLLHRLDKSLETFEGQQEGVFVHAAVPRQTPSGEPLLEARRPARQVPVRRQTPAVAPASFDVAAAAIDGSGPTARRVAGPPCHEQSPATALAAMPSSSSATAQPLHPPPFRPTRPSPSRAHGPSAMVPLRTATPQFLGPSRPSFPVLKREALTRFSAELQSGHDGPAFLQRGAVPGPAKSPLPSIATSGPVVPLASERPVLRQQLPLWPNGQGSSASAPSPYNFLTHSSTRVQSAVSRAFHALRQSRSAAGAGNHAFVRQEMGMLTMMALEGKAIPFGVRTQASFVTFTPPAGGAGACLPMKQFLVQKLQQIAGSGADDFDAIVITIPELLSFPLSKTWLTWWQSQPSYLIASCEAVNLLCSLTVEREVPASATNDVEQVVRAMSRAAARDIASENPSERLFEFMLRTRFNQAVLFSSWRNRPSMNADGIFEPEFVSHFFNRKIFVDKATQSEALSSVTLGEMNTFLRDMAGREALLPGSRDPA